MIASKNHATEQSFGTFVAFVPPEQNRIYESVNATTSSLRKEPKSRKRSEEYFNYYISGFVDGEGCFSVSFRIRSKVKIGIEVRPSFAIAQKKSVSNRYLLERIKSLFRCGAIRDDGRDCYKYETRALMSIVDNVIPFFRKYKLYTDKAQDFSHFSEICLLMAKGHNLEKEGLTRVLGLSKKMNSSGTRRYRIEELETLLERKE